MIAAGVGGGWWRETRYRNRKRVKKGRRGKCSLETLSTLHADGHRFGKTKWRVGARVLAEAWIDRSCVGHRAPLRGDGLLSARRDGIFFRFLFELGPSISN